MTGTIKISKEYKNHESGLYRYRTVKSGREFRGEIREYPIKVDGAQLRIYWSARLRGEYFVKDEGWCIDKAVYDKLTTGFCVTHFGVLVTIDSKRKISDKNLIEDYWLTTKELFIKHRVDHNYAGVIGKSEGAKGKFGSSQWKVPMIQHAHVIAYVPDEYKLKEIMVSPTRSKAKALSLAHL